MKTILLLALLFIATTLSAQKYSKVKIYADADGISHLFNEGVAVDHGHRKAGHYIVTDLSEYDIQKVEALHYQYEILIDDVKKFYVQQNIQPDVQKNTTCSGSTPNSGVTVPDNFQVQSTYGGYYKYNEMLQELDEMATLYPHLISVKAPISTFLTWENRPIYHVKISNNPNSDDGDPMALYSAIHHAREPMSMSQLIFYMWYLLENYDNSPEIKYLVDNTQMIFVPCVNPDGYIHNETTDPNGGGMHRKNKNPNVGNSNPGVDINRNYSYGWNTTGVSADANNDTYPGTAAFSEPETQAMRWLVQNYPIRSALNAHTYGDMLLFPIGTTANEYADHHNYFQTLSNHMVQYNGYEATKSSGLYPASGDSDDYMYKVDNGVLEKDTVFAMTPEIGGSFWPASSEIIPTCQEMVFVNLGLAHMVHKYYIVKEDDPLQVSTLSGTFHHTVTKLGIETGAATVSLEPLLNIQSVGTPVTYNLGAAVTDDGTISYTLNASIQDGDEIKYVLTTDDGNWIQRDTITKIYGNAGTLTETVSDNANNINNWTGNWNTTTSTYYSPSSSFTDSPGANYQNNATRTFTFNTSIDLTDMEIAKATFYAKWDVETDYDFCQFQVSTDGGANWEGQCGLYTAIATNGDGVQPVNEPVWHGVKSDWVNEEINLSEYLGQTINVRFVLKSDGGVRKDGFYFDDFKILTKAEETQPGVGVSNLTENKLKIYPNPAMGKFYVDGLESNDVIEMIDLRGITVLRMNTGNEKVSVDASTLSNGVYFVKISGQNQSTEKILIQK
jgi:carboxypeptidase T